MFSRPRQVPPLVDRNIVSVAIGACTDGRVARGGHSVGVVVVALGKVGAAPQKEVETVRGLEVGAKSIQIIASKLVENEDHQELGLRVVRTCEGYRSEGSRSQGRGKDEREKALAHAEEYSCEI